MMNQRRIIKLISALNLATGIAYIMLKNKVNKQLQNELQNGNDTQHNELDMIIGEDAKGNVIKTNLKSLEHLLITGMNGSGKSIAIDSLIVSLLQHSTPDDLKIMFIDSKMIEFKNFETLPYLWMPVITDMDKIKEKMDVLNNEIDKRIELLKRLNIKNIDEYQEARKYDKTLDNMPNIVLIIDDLNDVGLYNAKNINDIVEKISQKGMLIGVHMILMTQTIPNNQIGETIKESIPSRLVFKMINDVESLKVIGDKGAERLLPHGHFILKEKNKNQRFGQSSLITINDFEMVSSEQGEQYVLKKYRQSSCKTVMLRRQKKKAIMELNELDKLIQQYLFYQHINVFIKEKSVNNRFAYFKYELPKNDARINVRQLEKKLKLYLRKSFVNIIHNKTCFEITTELKYFYQIPIDNMKLFNNKN